MWPGLAEYKQRQEQTPTPQPRQPKVRPVRADYASDLEWARAVSSWDALEAWRKSGGAG